MGFNSIAQLFLPVPAKPPRHLEVVLLVLFLYQAEMLLFLVLFDRNVRSIRISPTVFCVALHWFRFLCVFNIRTLFNVTNHSSVNGGGVWRCECFMDAFRGRCDNCVLQVIQYVAAADLWFS